MGSTMVLLLDSALLGFNAHIGLN